MGKEQKVSTLFKPSRCIWAVIISIIVLLSNYFICNTSFPLPDEMKILRSWDIIKELAGQRKGTIPIDVLLIDIAYDKELVTCCDTMTGKELGKTPITDRQKLLDFLSRAQKANNYKYILLDVNFEKGLISEADSALFKTICEMDRIVIPRHEGQELQDEHLYEKACLADYTVTREESNFSRFQFKHNGKKSVPLKMYEDICNKHISHYGPFYFCDNWLCRNGITLKLPYSIPEDNSMRSNTIYIPNLGEDFLKEGFTEDKIEDKIIVIGDFKNDMHDTYLGRQPGAIINLNAFYALVQEDHILLGKYCQTFIFYLFTAILYFFLALMYLNRKSPSSFFKNPWIKVLISIISISALFFAIAIIAYISPLDIVYNVWIPTAIFSVLDFIVSTYQNYKDEKNKISTHAATVVPDSSKCS